MRAFTIPELLIVVAVLGLLVVLAVPSFGLFRRESSLENTAEEIRGAFVLAQSRAVASEGTWEYGLFFNDSSVPQEYVVFRGSSYASRDMTADRAYELPSGVQFATIDLQPASETAFGRLSGEPNNPGSVTLRLVSDPDKARVISLGPSGTIAVGEEPLPSDADRVKDSRHAHVVYSTRTINTLTENMDLTFSGNSGPVTEMVIISNALQGGNIEWSGTIAVDGEDQLIEVRTHRLNDPDTEFSVIRDRRYNTKALEISLSGESGDLIIYDTDGNTTKTSSFAEEAVWQ